VFVNPLRNVSDNLIKLFRYNSKHKKVILPVFKSLGYNKKQKKFEKWPILLKDFVLNLHSELAEKNQSRGNLSLIKQEVNEAQQRPNKTRSGSKDKVESSKVSAAATLNVEAVKSDSKDLIKEESDQQIKL